MSIVRDATRAIRITLVLWVLTAIIYPILCRTPFPLKIEDKPHLYPCFLWPKAIHRFFRFLLPKAIHRRSPLRGKKAILCFRQRITVGLPEVIY